MNFDKAIASYIREGNLQNRYRECLNPVMYKNWKAVGLNDTFFVAGDDSHLVDQHGNNYLDFASGFGTQILGRNNKAITETVKQMFDSNLSSLEQFGIPVLATILAEKLLVFSDSDFQKVFFTNSGTEAVEAALKLTICATGKRNFIFLKDSFHGLTLGSLSVNGSVSSRNVFTRPNQNFQVNPNNLDQIGKIIKAHHRNLAGVILEPVMGKCGIVMTNEYIKLVRDLCDKFGLILIFDEIQSGFYRCSKKFAYQLFNIKPDIIVVSKALSGGIVPIGAVLYKNFVFAKAFRKKENMDMFSGTFNENNLAMAIALTVLEQLQCKDYGKVIANHENLIRKHLGKSGNIEVRGKGLLLCFYYTGSTTMLHKGVELFEKNHLMKLVMIRMIKEHKIITFTHSTIHNCIKILPSYSVSENNIVSFCEKLRESVDYYTRQSGREFLLEVKNTYASMKS